MPHPGRSGGHKPGRHTASLSFLNGGSPFSVFNSQSGRTFFGGKVKNRMSLRPPQQGRLREMSSLPPPLQCLFCNHLNPAGASFCNDCGSQMHLQPCDRCGAINKRTARNCYKCDAGFTLLAAPEPDSAPQEAGIEKLRTSAPVDATPPFPESAPPYEIVSSASAVTANGSRRTVHFGVPAMVLVAMAVGVYYFLVPSAPSAKRPGAAPLASGASGTLTSVSVAPATADAPIDPASAATGVTPKPVAAISAPGEAPAPAPPKAVAAMTARQSPPPDAEPMTPPPAPPILVQCPDAVAALGLCSSATKEETK